MSQNLVSFIPAIVEVSAHQRAKIVSLPNDKESQNIVDPLLWSDPNFLTSSVFELYETGENLLVLIKTNGKTRLVKHVFTALNEGFELLSYSNFIKNFEMKMLSVKWGDSLTEAIKEVNSQIETRFNIDKIVGHELEIHPPKDEVNKREQKVYVSNEDMKIFEAVKKVSEKRHTSVLMVGSSGYGKTTIPEYLAKKWDMDFIRWDCANVRDTEEFFGYRAAINGSIATEDGELFFIETEFVKKVKKGNCIVVLDELNRTDPYITNALFPLLDHAGKTTVAGYDIEVGENVIFVGTINVGHEFTGTFALDQALVNRFIAKIVVGPLPTEVEIELLQSRVGIDKLVAKNLVNFLTKLRNLNKVGDLSIDASTRVSLNMAELLKSGLDMKLCITCTIINGISDNESKLVMDSYRF